MANPDLFGPRLRELRAAAGLTLAELASKAGLTPDAIVKLESGRRKPGWDTALALASALGVDCTAFTVEPTPEESKTSGSGQPHKATATDGPTNVQAGQSEPQTIQQEDRAKGNKAGKGKRKG